MYRTAGIGTVADVNPLVIESKIIAPALQHVRLIGELDLESESYEGRSLSCWSREVVDLVGPNSQKDGTLRLFPGALAVWFTERAQNVDGSAFWRGMPDWVKQQRLGPAYIEALRTLGKPDFQTALVNSNRYVQAAKIHALLPPYAIPEVAKKVEAAVRAGWDAGDLRNNLLQSSNTAAVSVVYLLREAPEQATDLLDRMIKVTRHPELASELLPAHIVGALSGNSETHNKRATASLTMPRLQLGLLDYPELLVVLPESASGRWSLIDHPTGALEPNQVLPAPVAPILVQSEECEPITLVPEKPQALVFSRTGRYVKTGLLPNAGGILVVENQYKVSPDPYASLDRLSGEWRTHTAYEVAAGDYEILDPRGDRVALVTSQTGVSVSEEIVPRLYLNSSQPVYSEIPRLLSDRALVIDNENGDSAIRSFGEEVVAPPHSPHISLSLKGQRLGDQYEIEGLVMPGTAFQASTRTLLPDRASKAKLVLPAGWRGPETFELAHGDLHRFTVTDSSGQAYELSASFPSLSWALHHQNEDAPAWTAEPVKGLTENITDFNTIWIHHGEDAPPVTRVFLNGRSIHVLEPERDRSRTQTFTTAFDLRSLHALARTSAAELVEIRTLIGHEEVTLVQLQPRPKKPWRTVSRGELGSAAGYSQDDLRAARRENLDAELAERRERDRRLTDRLRRASRGL